MEKLFLHLILSGVVGFLLSHLQYQVSDEGSIYTLKIWWLKKKYGGLIHYAIKSHST